MKNFDWTRYTKKIAVRAPLHTMYAAWTSAEELENWFLEQVKFYDTNNRETGRQEFAQNEFAYAWKWHLFDEVMNGKMIEANGKDFIRFTFEGDSVVEVKMTTERDYTIIELTHKDIPTDDSSKQNIRLGCASGWTFYLINLKSVYEGGLDLRNKDTHLPLMINN